MKCKERMEEYLRQNGVAFEVETHAQAFTMQEVAAALHVSGNQVAKVVIVCADDDKVMAVLPAPYRLNVELLRDLIGAKRVRLAKEEEFSDLFPDCATGAMPPFGNLYGVPVYADGSMAEEPDMVFRIGTHRETMKIAYADFFRLVKPVVGDFSWQM
jgi:Ala-tRNA(Pro) deacylase